MVNIPITVLCYFRGNLIIIISVYCNIFTDVKGKAGI